MEGNRIKGVVSLGITLVLVVGLIASTGAAGVLAAHSTTADDSVQSDMNNSTNTSAPSPATMGTLNNSSMASLSNDQLATRALELQRVISATQDQYLTQIRTLELQLNAAQQGNGSNATGGLPSTNGTMANATTQSQGVAPLNNSTLSGMSHDQLEAQVLQLQQVENQTQTQYLRMFRELQIQLDDQQANGSNGTQLPNVTQKVNTSSANSSNASNQTNTTEHTRNVTNATNGSSAMNATNATNATTMANMSNATSATSSMATNASTTNAAGGSTTGTGSAGGSTSGGSGGGNSSTTSSSNGPGFGVLVAVAGLLAAAGIALRRN